MSFDCMQADMAKWKTKFELEAKNSHNNVIR